MDDNPKQVVQDAYDHIAEWYLRWVDGQPSPRERYAAKVLHNHNHNHNHNHRPASPPPNTSSSSNTDPGPPVGSKAQSPPPPRILELGCGPGVPITRLLLDGGAHVVANDISPAQLRMARERCPQAEFVGGDMAALEFAGASFDGAVSFFTIFHLPRAEQRGMLERICGWLKPGGLFVFNLATVDEEEIYGEMMGHGMFWSSFAVEESEAMVRAAGFEVVEMEELESEPDEGVKFLWIAARKPGHGG